MSIPDQLRDILNDLPTSVALQVLGPYTESARQYFEDVSEPQPSPVELLQFATDACIENADDDPEYQKATGWHTPLVEWVNIANDRRLDLGAIRCEYFALCTNDAIEREHWQRVPIMGLVATCKRCADRVT